MSHLHHHLLSAIAFAGLLAPTNAQNVGAAFDPMVDGYIEVPYSPNVVPRTGITVEAWITYDETTLPTGWRYPTIVRQGISVNGSEDYFLRIEAGQTNSRVLSWRLKTVTNGNVVVNWTFAAGQLVSWTHVAATYDGAFARLFVNGAQVAQASGAGAIRDINNEVLRIGKGSDVATPIEVWNGQIDEVRLWPFARTQADIQAAMNQELVSIPGLVSTWNLNGLFVDSSGTQHATASGQVTFTVNPLILSAPLVPPFAAGASTPGCLGPLTLAPTATAKVGNPAFGIVCHPTPPGAFTILGLSFGVLASPFPLLGVDIWLDPTVIVTFGATSNSLGAAYIPLPIDISIPPGFLFGAQALVLDACGTDDFTASNALVVFCHP